MCDCCAEHMRNSHRTLTIDEVSGLNSFARIEQILSSLPGILMSEYLPDRGQARITYDARVTGPERMHDKISHAGYKLN